MPRLFECGVLCDGRPWIAMELVQGESLGERMRRGAISPDEVLDLVGSVAGVLVAAHDRGITHRDLKPDNLFLTPGDRVYPIRLIDWGIAHHEAGSRYTDLNEAIGTPTYMAPEQARGGIPQGYCDVYGLGVIAYHALAGHPPFTGRSPVEILVQHMNRPVPSLAPRCPDAPIALVELVERMLEKRVDSRPTAAEICEVTERLRTRTEQSFPPIKLYVDGIPSALDDPPTTSLRAPHLDD
jgi:serine/threonine-protein kinase